MHLFIPAQQVAIAPVAVSWSQDGKDGVTVHRDEHAAYAWYSENSLWDHGGRIWSETGKEIAAPVDQRPATDGLSGDVRENGDG